MQLSAELFQQIIKSIRAEVGVKQEKRGTPRVGMRYMAAIAMIEEGKLGKKEQVRVRDLSPGGLCLIYPKSITKGRQFIIQLPRQKQEPMTVLCEVRYSRMLSNELYSIGAQFTRAGARTPEAGETVQDAQIDSAHLQQIEQALTAAAS